MAFILAGVPMDDTGGGSRGAQIAAELLHREWMVAYLHGFPRQESVDLAIPLEHPHLVHLPARDFAPKAFGLDYAEVMSKRNLFCLVEFPLREFLELASVIKQWRGRVVYDLIDDWDTSLGGSWYQQDVERSLIDSSDLLTATAPVLADRLRRASGRDPLLLPNAVNLRLFDPRKERQRPADLPEGRPVLIYVGALWGEWFDWDLLVFLAKSLPRAAVVVIGDYRGQCPSPPSNLHFLGLKPQSHLPRYLAHADVGILPWKVSKITQATSPLKIYEYLAMGKPVVAPRLDPLLRVPHVMLAEGAEDFLAKIRQAQPLHLEDQMLRDFLADNSWESRVDSLSRALAALMGGKADEPQDGR
jgi:glycosyltransferase involved in cell wall biosynthesis